MAHYVKNDTRPMHTKSTPLGSSELHQPGSSTDMAAQLRAVPAKMGLSPRVLSNTHTRHSRELGGQADLVAPQQTLGTAQADSKNMLWLT